jgi:hypothetical protein
MHLSLSLKVSYMAVWRYGMEGSYSMGLWADDAANADQEIRKAAYYRCICMLTGRRASCSSAQCDAWPWYGKE